MTTSSDETKNTIKKKVFWLLCFLHIAGTIGVVWKLGPNPFGIFTFFDLLAAPYTIAAKFFIPGWFSTYRQYLGSIPYVAGWTAKTGPSLSHTALGVAVGIVVHGILLFLSLCIDSWLNEERRESEAS